MKKILMLIFALTAMPLCSFAQSDDVVVSDGWARPILIAGRPGSAYFHIENHGSMADKLLGVSSSLAPRLELHEHTMKDGIMKMGQVMSIDVPGNGSVDLKPGGYHIMIFDSTKQFAPGDEIDITLKFEKAGEIKKTVKVLAQPPK
ncbi:MAG: copper chaperone PCu(A)C [Alphaproteobacteria bacterium]|nr:copper chaperone PCu(A)C [Alphaproteobacteria bacterium]HPF45383.1 copper chaperone PCu(A)C [Emcibacteraceae bacterium]HRW28939.1 copper chaperone PCu(A)C [Emcibacteraceae bacterium]